jgi:hypothetical protein
MRLCEKQKTGKAMWAELVKALIHNRQAAFMHGLRKQRVCPLAINENLMVAVGEIENEVLSQFQSRVHSHLHGYRVPPNLLIFIWNFNLILLGRSQMISEPGGKNRKNPPENTIFCRFFHQRVNLLNCLRG